jgi:radical SAM-linked protein
MPRLANANALPIGQEGYGEVLDLELLKRPEGPVTPDELRALLVEPLPPEISIRAIQEIGLRDPSATEAVYAAEYQLTVSCESPTADWPAWVTQILDAREIWIEKVSKSGKASLFNARPLLYYLEFQGLAPDGSAYLFYRGSCRNNGAYLRPNQLLQMAEALGLPRWTLQAAKRLRLLWEDGTLNSD